MARSVNHLGTTAVIICLAPNHLPMLFFVLLGYESALFLARLLLAPVLAQLPWGTLILWTAAVLWRTRWNGEARLNRGHRMFMTTLLNPNSLLR